MLTNPISFKSTFQSTTLEAPQVIFLHPAPMHPHIYTNGHICLGNLSFYAYLINLSYDLFLDKVVP